MARTYYIKKVPKSVSDWFSKKYPSSEGNYAFRFYKYFSGDKTKTYYGCEVRKDGELWSYFAQGTEEDFKDDFKPLEI